MSTTKAIKKEKKKVWKIIFNVLFYTVLGVFVVYFVCNTIDIKTGYNFPFLGVRHTVITSQSMSYVDASNVGEVDPKSERIRVNDVVVSTLYKSYNEVKIGDVIIFASNDNLLICHRVRDKYEDNGKKYIVTRGDANASDDTPISFGAVKGKVTRVIPKIGGFLLFIQSYYFLIAVFGSIFFVSLGMFIADSKRSKKADAGNADVIDQKPEEIKKKE